jgi:uncharacterized protein (TIGR03435 family)
MITPDVIYSTPCAAGAWRMGRGGPKSEAGPERANESGLPSVKPTGGLAVAGWRGAQEEIRKMIRAMAGIGWMAAVCSLAFGQAAGDGKRAEAKLEFEVASVKPAAPQTPDRMMMGIGGGPGSNDPGRMTITNLTLRDLVTFAYGVKRSQISGGPGWLDTERFDITAKVPQGATKEQMKVMLQNLLADRFQLALHHETKEMAMYALVVGKNGPKMKESAMDAASAAAPQEGGPGTANGGAPRPPSPMMAGRGGIEMGKDGCPEVPAPVGNRPYNLTMFMNGTACMVDANQTMSGLADQLSSQFDRPVVDMTGLQGKYDFHMRFDLSTVGSGRGGMMMMAGPPPAGMAAGGGPGPGGDPGVGPGPRMEALETAPTIFVAVQEQLGLKLEPRKGPADLLVIDHVEKTPTEN